MTNRKTHKNHPKEGCHKDLFELNSTLGDFIKVLIDGLACSLAFEIKFEICMLEVSRDICLQPSTAILNSLMEMNEIKIIYGDNLPSHNLQSQ